MLPGTALGADPDLTSPVVVLTVRQAKGLEFDCVLIADPAQILAESPRGLNDLYVALTRATQRVGVVHPGEIPGLRRLLAGPAPPEPGWPVQRARRPATPGARLTAGARAPGRPGSRVSRAWRR